MGSDQVVCEVCGAPVAAKSKGRPPRYCRPACRQEAYRRRQAPDAEVLRDQLTGQLDQLQTLDWAAVRAGLDRLEAAVLLEVHRHLEAALAPLVTITGRHPTAAAAPPPASVTNPDVTEAVTQPDPPPAPHVASPVPSLPARPRADGTVGGLRPTEEQAAIIAACGAGKHLVIEAVAGSGKTSSLRMAAAAMAGRGLYIAFNKAIAMEAKRSFPASVSCSTAHALAFRAVGHAYKHRLDGPRLPARETAKRLGIDTDLVAADRRIEPAQLARLAMETVGRYCRTADDDLQRRHVPAVNGVDGAAADRNLEGDRPRGRGALDGWGDASPPDW